MRGRGRRDRPVPCFARPVGPLPRTRRKRRRGPNTSPSSRGSASPAPKRPSVPSAASAPTSAPNGFRVAAAKFAKAKRIFAGTVSSISTVPRPAADRATLTRWFAALGREALPRADRRRAARRRHRPLPARLGPTSSTRATRPTTSSSPSASTTAPSSRRGSSDAARLSEARCSPRSRSRSPSPTFGGGAGGRRAERRRRGRRLLRRLRSRPRDLPRDRPAPVSLTLAGASPAPTTAPPPPRLRRIEIAFGARGGLDTDRPAALSARAPSQRHQPPGARPLPGRPRRPRHDPRRSPARSRANRCSPAPASSPSTDARAGARPSGFTPTRPRRRSPSSSPSTCAAVATGAYGMLMRSPGADAPSAAGRACAPSSITLGRRYRAGGELHSYLSARCPLPPRFTSASFPSPAPPTTSPPARP